MRRASGNGSELAEARPTSGHMAVAALVNGGHVRQVISQNVDGLHMRSGVPVSQLTELHGNVFRERCPSCAKEYLRGFDVTGKSSYHRHGTERTCERKACEQCELRDTIVYFGEKIYPSDLQTAKEQSEACDLAIFIGSSLKVLAHYAFIWQPLPKPRKKRIVIVNLQPTPKDKQADIRIFGRCDDVLERLMRALGLSMPSYQPDKDAVLKLAMALPPPPLPPPKPPSLPPPPPDAELGGGGGSSDAAPSYSNPSAAAVPPSEPMGAEMEGEEEEEAESPSMAFVPPKKRRKKALTYKKKALPRAFPAARQRGRRLWLLRLQWLLSRLSLSLLQLSHRSHRHRRRRNHRREPPHPPHRHLLPPPLPRRRGSHALEVPTSSPAARRLYRAAFGAATRRPAQTRRLARCECEQQQACRLAHAGGRQGRTTEEGQGGGKAPAPAARLQVLRTLRLLRDGGQRVLLKVQGQDGGRDERVAWKLKTHQDGAVPERRRSITSRLARWSLACSRGTRGSCL